MEGYYQKKLSSGRLQQVYDLAPPRIRQYLRAELDHALEHISGEDLILDLGCGYGRQFPDLCARARFVVGIDSSSGSLETDQESLSGFANFLLVLMNARKLQFPANAFDAVLCLQNGISAFHIDPRRLIREALRVTRPGGTVLFSSYSEKFWQERLHWFHLQSEAGLLGKIDPARTRDGFIVCDDGFTATTVNEAGFRMLTAGLRNVTISIEEVDQSSLFCKMVKW